MTYHPDDVARTALESAINQRRVVGGRFQKLQDHLDQRFRHFIGAKCPLFTNPQIPLIWK
jgi:hypothetical protein